MVNITHFVDPPAKRLKGHMRSIQKVKGLNILNSSKDMTHLNHPRNSSRPTAKKRALPALPALESRRLPAHASELLSLAALRAPRLPLLRPQEGDGCGSKPMVPLINIKIGGAWVFIRPKMEAYLDPPGVPFFCRLLKKQYVVSFAPKRTFSFNTCYFKILPERGRQMSLFGRGMLPLGRAMSPFRLHPGFAKQQNPEKNN